MRMLCVRRRAIVKVNVQIAGNDERWSSVQSLVREFFQKSKEALTTRQPVDYGDVHAAGVIGDRCRNAFKTVVFPRWLDDSLDIVFMKETRPTTTPWDSSTMSMIKADLIGLYKTLNVEYSYDYSELHWGTFKCMFKFLWKILSYVVKCVGFYHLAVYLFDQEFYSTRTAFDNSWKERSYALVIPGFYQSVYLVQKFRQSAVAEAWIIIEKGKINRYINPRKMNGERIVPLPELIQEIRQKQAFYFKTHRSYLHSTIFYRLLVFFSFVALLLEGQFNWH